MIPPAPFTCAINWMLIDSSQRTHSLMLILAHPVVILILITPVQSSFYVHSSYFLMSPFIFHGTIFPLCVFSVLKLIKQIQICICSLCLLQTTPFLIMQGSLWCTMQSYLEIFLPVLYIDTKVLTHVANSSLPTRWHCHLFHTWDCKQ